MPRQCTQLSAAASAMRKPSTWLCNDRSRFSNTWGLVSDVNILNISAAFASAPTPSSSVRCRFGSFEFSCLAPAPGIAAANRDVLQIFKKGTPKEKP
jgi:hypothetical protein